MGWKGLRLDEGEERRQGFKGKKITGWLSNWLTGPDRGGEVKINGSEAVGDEGVLDEWRHGRPSMYKICTSVVQRPPSTPMARLGPL